MVPALEHDVKSALVRDKRAEDIVLDKMEEVIG